MVELKRSPDLAPEYAYHREVSANDAALPTDKRKGMNFHSHEFANIQVVAGAGADPDAEVVFWSEVAGAFVQYNPVLTKTGLGTGKSYEFTVPAYGRIIYVMITGLGSGETCKVLCSGFGVKMQ